MNIEIANYDDTVYTGHKNWHKVWNFVHKLELALGGRFRTAMQKEGKVVLGEGREDVKSTSNDDK